MLSNREIENLFTYGVEGVHWVMVDEEHGSIDYPEGVNAQNSGYPYGFGFYFNRSLPGAIVGFGKYDPTVLTDADVQELAKDNHTMQTAK